MLVTSIETPPFAWQFGNAEELLDLTIHTVLSLPKSLF